MRPSSSRRSFLKHVPATIAAGIAAPAIVIADQTPSAPAAPQATGPITAETLGIAQRIVGVDLPVAERELARTLVQRNLTNIEAVRNVSVPAELEPAFSFHPAASLRGAAKPAATTTPRTARPKVVVGPRPANLEDVAFESVAMLGARLRAKQFTSTELTKMYLARLKRADATLFCVVTLTEELALAQAAQADKEIAAGKWRGPLHGIPYGI
jgi:hypothetical protein